MIEVNRVISAPPQRVFAVLADGWSYAGWVVGTAHIRRVYCDWPAEGAHIHHKAGMWPVQVPDVSTVVAVSPGQMIELDARLWVLGRARIRITLTPVDAASTRVGLQERVVAGPAAWLPVLVQALLLRPRNRESLARLEDVVIARSRWGQA
jgi:uncharacterized protein YndB with AHSA1/START domain